MPDTRRIESRPHETLLRALTWFPLPLVYPWGWIMYFVAFRILRWRRKRVLEDVARAFPDKSAAERFEIVRKMYRNLGDGLIEALWGYGASAEEFRRRVVMENPELVHHYADAGKTVLLLAAHVCNWEWLFLGAGAHFGIPMMSSTRHRACGPWSTCAMPGALAATSSREDFISRS
jgi:lauroyl/myristoyl acyltransferase